LRTRQSRFFRIAEEAEQRAAKNLSDDTYTLVLTNDEMNAIWKPHGISRSTCVSMPKSSNRPGMIF
jgi:hypothetical protein